MRLFIECLPYLCGLLTGLLLAGQSSRATLLLRWLLLSTGAGLLINRLSGEAFSLVILDIGVVAAVALVTYMARRAVSG